MDDIDLNEVRKLVSNCEFKRKVLAAYMGVSPRTLSRFMSGKANLGRSALILLLQKLNADIETLKTKAS